MTVEPLRVIRAYMDEGRYSEALQEARRYYPHLHQKAEFHVMQAICYTRISLPQKALECLREALALEPDNPEHYSDLAILLLQMDQPDSAAQMIERARRLAPDNVLILKRWSLIQIARSRVDAAREGLLTLIQTKQADASDTCWLAELSAADGGNLFEARHWFEKSLELEPCHQRALTGLAAVLEALGEDYDAALILGRLVELEEEPERLQIHLKRLGEAHLRYGNRRAARRAFVHSLKLRPDQLELQRKVGTLYLQEGNYGKARLHLEVCVSEQADIDSMLKLSFVAEELNDSSKCEKLLLEAVHLACSRNESGVVATRLARYYFAHSRAEEGRTYTLQAARCGVGDKENLIQLLQASEEQSRLDEDLMNLVRDLFFDQGFWEALYLHFAAKNAHEEALGWLQRGLLYHPNAAVLHYYQASSCGVLGDVQGSLKALRNAIERDRRWRRHARGNPCFRNLAPDPRFLELISEEVSEL